MSTPADQASDAIPVDQDFSFLRAQPQELRRGMLERARSGDFLANFHDRTPEERLKVTEWQDNMATFLEVMEERDVEAERAKLLLKLVTDLLDQGEIKPALRRLAREYTDALRDATTFEGPVRPSPANVALNRWLSGPPPPLRFPPGPAHLLSLFDYALRRATGRIPAPSTIIDDDLPDLIVVTDSSGDEAPDHFNPELARLMARRDLLDHFAERVVENDAAASADGISTPGAPAAAAASNGAPAPAPAVNGAAAAARAPAAPPAPITPAVNGVTPGVASINSTAPPTTINQRAGNRRGRPRRAVQVSDEDNA